jgi:hypothetical protein
MCHVTSSLLGGLAAVAAWALVSPPIDAPSRAAGANPDQPLHSAYVINRAAKADRWTPSRGSRIDESEVATVEVVGIRDAAIIYRDRNGRILFQTDPVSNVTVISKGFVLPELTIRETKRSKPAPVEVPHAKPRLPIGCDPAASPIAQPQLSHLPGRCLAGLTDTTAFAARG